MINSGVIIFMFTVMCFSCVPLSSGRATSVLINSGGESIRIAGYGEEKLSTVIVTGTLLCTSDHHLQILPISGAQVAVSCNSRSSHCSKRGRSLIRGMTNKNGELSIDMPSHLHAIPDLHKACSLKVLTLPKHSSCQSASAALKHRGYAIVFSSAGNGIRSYSAGTLHFRPHGHGTLESLKRCKRESHGSY